MRLFLALFASAAWMAVTASTGFAAADEPNNDHRRSMGNLRPDHRTAGPAVEGSPPPESARRRGWIDQRPLDHEHYPPYDHGYWHHGHRYPFDYGYDPYYAYPYPPYPPYPPYYWRYPYVPPVYIPAEALYGPQAVKRFMGVDQMVPPAANPPIIVIRGGDDDDDGDHQPQEPAQRAGSQRAVNLGWRFIGFGDAYFANQKYPDAYQRYKKAAEAAPTLASAYFRQGYALVAMGNYPQAAKVLKRGLELDPAWARSDFRNDELYGDNEPAKRAHLDALAQAAEENANDADLQFLLGVFLYFDGRPDSAAPFFQRAARLSVEGDAALRGFLEQGEPDEG